LHQGRMDKAGVIAVIVVVTVVVMKHWCRSGGGGPSNHLSIKIHLPLFCFSK
jgi:hypothetical protein